MLSATRTCPRCEQEKLADEFAIDRHKASGRKSLCKACDRAKAAKYYAEHREERAAYFAVNPKTPEQRWEWYHQRGGRESRAAYRRRIRARAVEVYGGKCAWCGATEDLEFDHVGDDGKWHRELACETQWLARIARTGRPLVYWRLRLLCAPCHRGPEWRERRAARDGTPIG